MGIVHVDFHRIAGLVFFDTNAIFADLVAGGDDLGFDGVLVPGTDADVGI